MPQIPGKFLVQMTAILAGTVLTPSLFSASEQWIRLETPHFELFTTAGEKKGREAVLYFEQVRSFFQEASRSKQEQRPVRIVAFRSEGQYKPYRMNEGSVAYYAQSRNREFIVMEDISAEHYPAAIHEFVHLIIQRDGLKIPLWLNEGMAEFYSSLKPQGNKAVVGTLLPGRVQTLLTSKWLPIEVLASVNEKSPLYNERNKAGIFYAQSWLLVHMLNLSPDYRPNFTKFLLALANGQDTVQAFYSVYRKGVQDVALDLNQYSKSTRMYAELFNVKLEKSAEDPQVSTVSPLESGLVLGDLLTLVHKPDEARQAYSDLSKEYPGNPEVLESQGYLEAQEGHREVARQYFAQAFQAGSKSPRMCFDYAMLAWQASSQPKDAIPPLRRALELQPDYRDARLELGLALASERSFTEAIEQLGQIKNVTPQEAPSFFLALGYSDLATSRREDARKNAEQAKKWAKSAADIDQADALLRFVDAAAKASSASGGVKFVPPPGPARATSPADNSGPPQLRRPPAAGQDVHENAPRNPYIQKDDQISRVEGTAQRLDCEGRSAVLHVQVGRAAMVFEIPDPEKVLIKHSGEQHHDFSCGPQQPYPITVIYAAQPDLQNGAAGIVRELDF